MISNFKPLFVALAVATSTPTIAGPFDINVQQLGSKLNEVIARGSSQSRVSVVHCRDGLTNACTYKIGAATIEADAPPENYTRLSKVSVKLTTSDPTSALDFMEACLAVVGLFTPQKSNADATAMIAKLVSEAVAEQKASTWNENMYYTALSFGRSIEFRVLPK